MVPDGMGGYKLQGAYTAFNDDKGWPCINPPIAHRARAAIHLVYRLKQRFVQMHGDEGGNRVEGRTHPAVSKIKRVIYLGEAHVAKE
jgi:hypothetical protein